MFNKLIMYPCDFKFKRKKRKHEKDMYTKIHSIFPGLKRKRQDYQRLLFSKVYIFPLLQQPEKNLKTTKVLINGFGETPEKTPTP